MDNHGEAEWYVALNPDVDISADQLYALIERADAHGYALAGPLRREPWGVQGTPSTELPSPEHFVKAAVRSGRLSRRRVLPTGSRAPMTDAVWLAGSCLAIRRSSGAGSSTHAAHCYMPKHTGTRLER